MPTIIMVSVDVKHDERRCLPADSQADEVAGTDEGVVVEAEGTGDDGAGDGVALDEHGAVTAVRVLARRQAQALRQHVYARADHCRHAEGGGGGEPGGGGEDC